MRQLRMFRDACNYTHRNRAIESAAGWRVEGQREGGEGACEIRVVSRITSAVRLGLRAEEILAHVRG